MENEISVLMPHHLKVVLIEISNQCAHVEWIVDTTGKVDEMNRNNFDVNFVPGNCKVARQTRMFGFYGKLILFFCSVAVKHASEIA